MRYNLISENADGANKRRKEKIRDNDFDVRDDESVEDFVTKQPNLSPRTDPRKSRVTPQLYTGEPERSRREFRSAGESSPIFLKFDE